MAPYGKPLARFALDLKNELERRPTMADTPNYVLETYIRTTPEKLWRAYETLAKDKVRGASGKRLLTDIVSLVRTVLSLIKSASPISFA